MDKESQSCNLILHGAVECDKWSDDEAERVSERKWSDENYQSKK